MVHHQFIDSLRGHIEPMAEALGVEVWGVEYSGSDRGPVLRIFLDGPEGVSVDTCAAFSRDVSVLLDVEDLVPGKYILEVSSPGLERRFFSTKQMHNYTGKEIRVHLIQAKDGIKNFTGTLRRVNTVPDGEDDLSLEMDGIMYTFLFSEVKKAHLKHNFTS